MLFKHVSLFLQFCLVLQLVYLKFDTVPNTSLFEIWHCT